MYNSDFGKLTFLELYKICSVSIIISVICFRKIHKHSYNYVYRPRSLCLCENKYFILYRKSQVIIHISHKHVFKSNRLYILFPYISALWVKRLIKLQRIFFLFEQVCKHTVLVLYSYSV